MSQASERLPIERLPGGRRRDRAARRATSGRRLPLLLTAALLVALATVGCTRLKVLLYEGWGRDASQKPDEVIAALDLSAGDRVADLGAGGGYFTFRLAEAVGPEGRVYAIDVDPDMTDHLSERVREEGAENVEVVLAGFDDPGIPDGSVDLLFSCNVYHHLEDPSAYFARARRVLRPGGRVAIIDGDGGGWFQRWFGHATPPDRIRTQMEAAGYRLEVRHDFLPNQGFLVFRPSG